jgi:hypothetical protein
MGQEMLIQTINFVVILNILFSLFMFKKNNGRTVIVYRKLVNSIISYAVSLTPAVFLVYMLYSVAYKF